MPFELIRSESLYTPAMLSGGGASGVFAYGAWDGYGHWPLRIVRHDAARPDELTVLGTIDPGYGWSVSALALSGTRAVVAAGTAVTVVDFTGPDLVTTALQLSAVPTSVLADGRWLLAAAGSSLELVDTTAPTTRYTAAVPSPVDSLLAIAGGFVAFTDTGYVRVKPDAVSPTFVATTSQAVRAFRRAFADGAEALAAGPSTNVGKVRVVRLDLSAPDAPVVKKETELDGAYGSFAWDGGQTSTLEIQGDMGSGLYQGYVIHEGAEGFAGTRVPFPLWVAGDQTHVAAHASRLFLLQQSGGATTDVLFAFYRIR